MYHSQINMYDTNMGINIWMMQFYLFNVMSYTIKK